MEVLKSVKLHEFWLLMNVSWNLVDGPDANAYRYHQIKESNRDILDKTSPRTNVSWMQLLPAIAKELNDAGVELPGERDNDLEIWDWWKDFQATRTKLARTSQNRFQAILPATLI